MARAGAPLPAPVLGAHGPGFYRVEGNRYCRSAWDRGGDLKSHQEIVFGTLERDGERWLLPMNLTTFRRKDPGEVKRRVEGRLVFEEREDRLVGSFLGIAGQTGEGDVRVKVMKEGKIYPSEPGDGRQLPDLHIRIEVEKGFLSFLGARTVIRTTERRVVLGTLACQGHLASECYEIVGEVEIRLLAMGIPWSRRHYTSRQVVVSSIGLVEESYRRRNGAYSEIRLLSEAAGREECVPEG